MQAPDCQNTKLIIKMNKSFRLFMNNNIHFLFGGLGNVDYDINHNIYKLFFTFCPIYIVIKFHAHPVRSKKTACPPERLPDKAK